MSWFDANDSFLMEIAARDRIDDLRSTVDEAGETAEPTAEPTEKPPPVADRCPNRPRSFVVWWRATITDERSAA